jgi:hypothetical protein
VPALPDNERRTSYVLSGTTGPLSVGFAIYGDSTDYGDWIQVWLNGVLQDPSTYTLTSPTGPLATLPRPITNAQITFNAATTGTVQIVGARRPRRLSQFTEGRGVAARDLNQTITDLVAQNRERWDQLGRTVQAPPGETLSPLAPAATRAAKLLGFNGLGDVALYDLSSGGGGGGGGVILNCGVGVTCTPNPITGTGSLALSTSGVSAGTYGSATVAPVLTVNAQGQVTAATTATMAPAFASITGKPTTLTGYGIASPLPVTQGGTGGTVFTLNAPVLGNGSNQLFSGARSGSTTTFATTSGTFAAGNCPQFDSSGNIVDSGAPCGGTTSLSVANVTSFGAVGDCATDSTSGFQGAVNSASAAGGRGIVYVPPVPSGGCYLVGKINGTNRNGVTVLGNGPQSYIKVTAANKNWWDLAGSFNWQFRDLRISDDGVNVPDTLFFWANTTTPLCGLGFDRVQIDAKVNIAILYGYGFAGASSGTACTGGLSATNSSWTQRAAGATFASNPEQRTAVVRIDAQNLNAAGAQLLASENVTIGTGSGNRFERRLHQFQHDRRGWRRWRDTEQQHRFRVRNVRPDRDERRQHPVPVQQPHRHLVVCRRPEVRRREVECVRWIDHGHGLDYHGRRGERQHVDR